MIKALSLQEPSKHFKLALILSRVTKFSKKLAQISFYHIFRKNIDGADGLVNE